MRSSAHEDLPLASKNRLGYNPPSINHYVQPTDETLDLVKIDSAIPEVHETISLGSILSYISISCSMILTMAFESILYRFKKATIKDSETVDDENISSEEALDFAHDKQFPGESTPLNASLIMEEPVDGSADTEVTYIENPRPTQNLFDFIYTQDPQDEDDLDIGQYGTSLSISKTSNYKTNKELEPAPLVNHNDVTAAELLDTMSPPSDEYDRVIRNYYRPFKPTPLPTYSLTDAVLAMLPSFDPSKAYTSGRERIQQLISQERKAAESSIRPLSRPQLASVETLWRSRSLNQPVVFDFNIDITVKDIKTLADSCWLNDNVIDFYLNLVASRSSNIFCWTTHFFSTLKSKGYQGVARWAKRKKVDLTAKEMVIVPINIMGTHWAVAVIDNQQKSISYYDSLASRGNLRALELLNEYMGKESERLSAPQINYSLHPNVKTPQQQNGYDCGVFTCTVAKYLSEKSPLTFGQKDMPVIRRRMAFEIANKSLLGSESSDPHL